MRNKRETVSAHKREPGAQEGHVSALCKEWAGRSQAAGRTYPRLAGQGVCEHRVCEHWTAGRNQMLFGVRQRRAKNQVFQPQAPQCNITQQARK